MSEHNPLPYVEFPDAQVLSHPAVASFTMFPECIVEQLAGTYRLSWQQRNDKQLTMQRSSHIYPVYFAELGEGIVEKLKREGFTRESLKEGMIWNGDCVLCVQPFAAYEAVQRRTEEINRRRHSTAKQADALDQELQRLSELTGHRTGQRLVFDTPYKDVDVDAHVAVSKVLRDPSGHRAAPATPNSDNG